VARGAIPITTPNRFTQANSDIEDQSCKNGGDHRFLVEDELKRLGGKFEKVADWQSFAITDGLLVTGQNPASSTEGARHLLALLA
jgi:putative intracellular protease/amidase